MSYFQLENFFVNSSFITLLISTFFYWIQLGFFNTNNRFFANFGNLGLRLANLELFCFLCSRFIDSHHLPLSNLYESLLFLAWSLTILYAFILYEVNCEIPFTFNLFQKSNLGKGQKKSQSPQIEVIIGAIIAPSTLFIDAFASLTLPDNLKISTPLVPALQSNWLMMHVTLMIISYSMLILGCLFSITLLIFHVFSLNKQDPKIQILDNLSYRTLGFGFPLLTIGILSGAVWANQAWGSYWSWDPKETWAFITWIVFAIYFHFRLNKNWTGFKPARIAAIGFGFLWICYLGVNLLGKGLHSYGWF
jgi:cytochrome c-type biogenesis protein CcsB